MLGEDVQGQSQGHDQGLGQGQGRHTQGHVQHEDHIHDPNLVHALDLHASLPPEAHEDHGQPVLNAPLLAARNIQDRVPDQGLGHDPDQGQGQSQDPDQNHEAALFP